MIIPFYKYQGTGNDFVIINGIENQMIELDTTQIQHICSRKFGVGSDGLIIIKKSNKNHFKMDFYNPDGSQSFCGNGARCAVHFAYASNVLTENPCVFDAIDGEHKAFICKDEVKIEMSSIGEIEDVDASEYSSLIGNAHFLNTGSPHFASYVESTDEMDSIIDIGRQIRFSKRFKKDGVNVNLIYQRELNSIEMRTYERGVEDETLSCGTGATACALIHASQDDFEGNLIDVKTKGGDLKVSFDKSVEGDFSNVFLIGPAKQIFNGYIEI